MQVKETVLAHDHSDAAVDLSTTPMRGMVPKYIKGNHRGREPPWRKPKCGRHPLVPPLLFSFLPCSVPALSPRSVLVVYRVAVTPELVQHRFTISSALVLFGGFILYSSVRLPDPASTAAADAASQTPAASQAPAKRSTKCEPNIWDGNETLELVSTPWGSSVEVKAFGSVGACSAGGIILIHGLCDPILPICRAHTHTCWFISYAGNHTLFYTLPYRC